MVRISPECLAASRAPFPGYVALVSKIGVGPHTSDGVRPTVSVAMIVGFYSCLESETVLLIWKHMWPHSVAVSQTNSCVAASTFGAAEHAAHRLRCRFQWGAPSRTPSQGCMPHVLESTLTLTLVVSREIYPSSDHGLVCCLLGDLSAALNTPPRPK